MGIMSENGGEGAFSFLAPSFSREVEGIFAVAYCGFDPVFYLTVDCVKINGLRA